jgi:hypothetical protein
MSDSALREPTAPVDNGWTAAVRGSEAPVVINVRFYPDGSVNSIGEKPAHLEPQGWFKVLSAARTSFQALSGGRGVFRLQAQELDALRQAP